MSRELAGPLPPLIPLVDPGTGEALWVDPSEVLHIDPCEIRGLGTCSLVRLRHPWRYGSDVTVRADANELAAQVNAARALTRPQEPR